MADLECIRWLEDVLPQLGLRPEGFRRNRRQVCRRVRSRMRELELPDIEAYRARLAVDSDERGLLDSLARVTISRFYRDAEVFDWIRRHALPGAVERARRDGRTTVRVLSAGCASGEEPYTIAAIWLAEIAVMAVDMKCELVGVDAGEAVLARARRAVYAVNSLRELPPELAARAFDPVGAGDFPAVGGVKSLVRVNDACQRLVDFRRGDVRETLPLGSFDLVLCRNLVFTYFDRSVQCEMIERLLERMTPGATLVIGREESLPPAQSRHSPAHPGGWAFRADETSRTIR